jgi:hypothetical protein
MRLFAQCGDFPRGFLKRFLVVRREATLAKFNDNFSDCPRDSRQDSGRSFA